MAIQCLRKTMAVSDGRVDKVRLCSHTLEEKVALSSIIVRFNVKLRKVWLQVDNQHTTSEADQEIEYLDDLV